MAWSIDEDTLLELLNTTPVVDGVTVDGLAEPASAKAWLAARGGLGTDGELVKVRAARGAVQAVVRGEASAASLGGFLRDVRLEPALDASGLRWELHAADADALLPARLVLAWNELEETRPGRLRPCANSECNLFLLDRSNGNRAQWCSMAICGNRMKARRHYERTRAATG